MLSKQLNSSKSQTIFQNSNMLMGRLKTAPKHAQLIFFLFKEQGRYPNYATFNTILKEVSLLITGLNLLTGKLQPKPSSIKAYT